MKAIRQRVNYKTASVYALFLLLASCAVVPEKPAPDHLSLTSVAFDDLGGWNLDTPAEALAAFRHSCPALLSKGEKFSLGIAGHVSDWQTACVSAQKTPDDNVAARAYFEDNFRPYAAAGNAGDEGLFTGYYVPELRGSLQRGGVFQTPLYVRPADRIEVDLGLFKNDLKGQHIVGKVTDSKLIPYDDRAAIARGALEQRAQPLVWVDDAASAFFLEIQGSGHIALPDGSVMPIGYDGTNGRSYVGVGHVLADRGDLPKPVTMPAIRAWFAAHPDQAQAIMDANPSYVFFRRLPNDDIVGAEGVALTPGRSMAVDPSFVPLGVPVWLDSTDGQGAKIHRLMIAQDTGGAIKGAVRGDFFWGAGDNAAIQAGAMQSKGRYYLLLPKSVAIHDN